MRMNPPALSGVMQEAVTPVDLRAHGAKWGTRMKSSVMVSILMRWEDREMAGDEWTLLHSYTWAHPLVFFYPFIYLSVVGAATPTPVSAKCHGAAEGFPHQHTQTETPSREGGGAAGGQPFAYITSPVKEEPSDLETSLNGKYVRGICWTSSWADVKLNIMRKKSFQKRVSSATADVWRCWLRLFSVSAKSSPHNMGKAAVAMRNSG